MEGARGQGGNRVIAMISKTHAIREQAHMIVKGVNRSSKKLYYY